MPRYPRCFYPGIALHVVQRGNDRSTVFLTADDRQYYLAYLLDAARTHGVAIHAYVLMTNHVHLLVSATCKESLPRTMQALGRRYVRRFNAVHGRTGTLWEGRYKACAVDKDDYLFSCMRYIELNPVRAGIVAHPLEYPWSSAHANATGKHDPVVSRHPAFAAVGGGGADCQRVYAAWLEAGQDSQTVEAIRDATRRQRALGSARFREVDYAATGRRVGHSVARRARLA
jgi:putative transposase